MRKENNGTRYFGFDEFAKEVYGIEPPSSTLRNPDKRKELRDKFEKRYVCKSCGKPMSYLGGNVLCCTNEACKKDRQYILMDKKTKSLAQGIYGEREVI